MRALQGEGCGRAVRAASNDALVAASGTAVASGAATGRLSDRLASPGMHSFSHTSHATSALIATGAAASSARGGVIRVSSVVSPS